MAQTLQATDTAQFEHELNCFVLFLENHDGVSWNILRIDLRDIFTASNSGSDYFTKAIFRVTSFIESWKSTYWAKYAVNRAHFFNRQQNFVSAAAFNIAYDYLQECKLGNF